MQTPSKLALSFVHTKIVQYGQKRMDFRYMIYGLDKIPQDHQWLSHEPRHYREVPLMEISYGYPCAAYENTEYESQVPK